MSIFDEPKIDCHNHVFDPEHFPYAMGNFYHPVGQEKGTPAQFLRVLDSYGVGHALLVQPNSGYGSDNRCLLDAIARHPDRFKGVAIAANDATREELVQLKAQGIVGIAFNPALLGVAAYQDAASLLAHLAELGLFAQIQVHGDQLPQLLPLLTASDVRLVFDHCGRPDISAGIEQPAFQALLELGRRGRSHVKISGLSKFSAQAFPHEDCWPYIDALIEAFTPEACLWGSDWPFLRAPERIDYGTLLRLIETLIPDAVTRRKLLWDTPRRLFGFGSATAMELPD